MAASVPAADLDHILAHTGDIWRELAGTRIFITGGTGFFGVWLLEAIAAANDTLKVGVGVTVLSRDPASFLARMPHLAVRPEFAWLTGDTMDFVFPDGTFDYVIHLATASAEKLGAGDTALTLTTLLGTQRILQFARICRARRLLLASSGAVYGRQPPELGHIPETYPGAPNPQHRASTYGEIKRMSELMCALTPEVECIIARGFSFYGPHLPFTEKFAIGSFIRDAIEGGPIRIHGDGTPVRSYLYAADLAIWLVTLLLKGKPNQPYNVGSDRAIGLAELARQVAATTCGVTVEIAHAPTTGLPDRYVPDIQKARGELGLDILTPLSLGLERTVDWAARLPRR
ncbi:MAG: NAD-dependent epimerase/dehydratase family protein [Sulfurisoma sp.]|nr:NAD-dependent epimerase/dehydratase family protein [Sulfurisoma sp.]